MEEVKRTPSVEWKVCTGWVRDMRCGRRAARCTMEEAADGPQDRGPADEAEAAGTSWSSHITYCKAFPLTFITVKHSSVHEHVPSVNCGLPNNKQGTRTGVLEAGSLCSQSTQHPGIQTSGSIPILNAHECPLTEQLPPACKPSPLTTAYLTII